MAFRLMVPGLGGLLLATTLAAFEISTETLPPLPEPVSNNAVAVLDAEDGAWLISAMGLGAGKTHADIHNRAWALSPGAGAWQRLPDVPGEHGRLAGVAVAAAGAVWLFGGYTVADDGAELSTPEVFSWRPGQEQWQHRTDMAVPVDDATAHVYLDRYIYLVSGWHDVGNVNLVQMLDTQTLQWTQATPYPGAPVFGHAGGTVNGRLAVCGGVKITYPASSAAREFVLSPECWLGVIDPEDVRRINWQPLPAAPVTPGYRMAAVGDGAGRVVFAGGSLNPYNFDGIGYNGQASEPQATVFSLDLESLQWQMEGALEDADMDHRGLLLLGDDCVIAGGMLDGQQVTNRVIRFRLD